VDPVGGSADGPFLYIFFQFQQQQQQQPQSYPTDRICDRGRRHVGHVSFG
jgi:hypothetical protein